MATVNKYRVWCDTDSKYEYVWAETAPTACPTDTGHTIDTSKTSIVESRGDDFVDISNVHDETGRPQLRVESRDDHDTTQFTNTGDSWTTVTGESVGTGDATTTVFYLDNLEVRNVTVYVDAAEETNVSVDYTDISADGNEVISFSRGVITFDTAPANSAVITADYEYAGIADGTKAIWDFSADNTNPKTFNLPFCDPVHIKDGKVLYMQGDKNCKIDVYVVCPQGGYYLDNNKSIKVATTGEVVIDHYVVEQTCYGDVPMGIDFIVEARSKALPNYYFVRFVVDNGGTAANFRGSITLELNRQRTSVR
jgi:hypothetical protein